MPETPSQINDLFTNPATAMLVASFVAYAITNLLRNRIKVPAGVIALVIAALLAVVGQFLTVEQQSIGVTIVNVLLAFLSAMGTSLTVSKLKKDDVEAVVPEGLATAAPSDPSPPSTGWRDPF